MWWVGRLGTGREGVGHAVGDYDDGGDIDRQFAGYRASELRNYSTTVVFRVRHHQPINQPHYTSPSSHSTIATIIKVRVSNTNLHG